MLLHSLPNLRYTQQGERTAIWLCQHASLKGGKAGLHVCSDLTGEHRQYRHSTAEVAAARLKRLLQAMAGGLWGFRLDSKSLCR